MFITFYGFLLFSVLINGNTEEALFFIYFAIKVFGPKSA